MPPPRLLYLPAALVVATLLGPVGAAHGGTLVFTATTAAPIHALASDSTAPTVRMVSPPDGSSVAGTTRVVAAASDNVRVTRVAFRVDGTLRTVDVTSPFRFSLDTSKLRNGLHRLTARAFDAAGNAASRSATVNVANWGGACTWYTSPAGADANTGRTPTSPVPLRRAARRTVPGDVVCLLAGAYPRSAPLYLNRSGRPGAYVVYRAYNGAARVLWKTSDADDIFQVTSGTHHIEFRGLTFDGADRAYQGIKCNSGGHHVRAIRNSVRNTGGGGISSVKCDYMTIDGNLIHRVGYGVGWSSGISLNASVWSDSTAGFHSFVTNNIISGATDESSYHSDGNGIIVDLGGNIPPVLIANNVVYENGGRCIHNFHVRNVWVVNNTCYKNGLDARVGPTGEFTNYDAQNVHLINNIAYAWNGRYPYKIEAGSTVTFNHNLSYGGLQSVVPPSVLADPLQLMVSAPLFVAPPRVDSTADGQYVNALAPWRVGSRFELQADSPAVDGGVDPRTDASVTASLRPGLDRYLARDLRGRARPQGTAYDIGAYER